MENVNDGRDETATETSVGEFFERICTLPLPYQISDVQKVLLEAVRVLSTAEICQLEFDVAKATKIAPRALREATKIAENSHEEYGLLRRSSDFAAAMVQAIKDSLSVSAWVGGSLYGYPGSDIQGDESSLEVGSFVRYSPEELDRNVLEMFRSYDLVQRKHSRAEIVGQIASELRNDDFFQDATPGICVSNGFVSWSLDEGLQLEKHSSHHKARVKLQCNFNPDASFTFFEDRLLATLDDRSKVAALQEFAGSILFDIQPEKDEARRMCLLAGPQNSGKSTLLSIFQGLLPPQSIDSIPPDEWTQEKYRAKLEGVALNVVPELGGNMLVPAVQLKKLGSLEPITARRLYGSPFTFRPIARHLFATNELPRIPDKSNASGRRLLCVVFPRSLRPDEVDPDFVSKVLENPSGFINWAAQGAKRLEENKRFTIPTGHEKAAALMQHGDDVAAILAHTRIVSARGERLTSDELQAALRRLSVELDLNPDRVNDGTMRRLSGLLQNAYGSERKQNSGKPFYVGVRFREGAESFAREEVADERDDLKVDGCVHADLADM